MSMAKRLRICAPHHSSSEGPEERPVVVIVTELSGRSTLWRLPRLGTVEHLRVLLSHPDEGLTSLDVAGLDGARSLASFDVCGEDAMVLELQDCFERDARVTVAQRVEYPFLQGLFGLLDYRTSVPRGGELLRRVVLRLEDPADLRDVALAIGRGYHEVGLRHQFAVEDTIYFEQPLVGFLRQFLRRWLRGLHTVRGPVSWCRCSQSIWRLFGSRDRQRSPFDDRLRLLYSFERAESTGRDLCRLFADLLSFPDGVALHGWGLRSRFAPAGEFLEVSLEHCAGAERFPLDFTGLKLELAVLPRELQDFDVLWRRGLPETDNVHLHFRPTNAVLTRLERALRRVEPGFGGIPRECAEYRLEISRALNSPRRAVVAEESSLDGAGIYV